MAKARTLGDHSWGVSGLQKVSVQHQSPAVISGRLILLWSLSVSRWYQRPTFHTVQVMISEGKCVTSFFVSGF